MIEEVLFFYQLVLLIFFKVFNELGVVVTDFGLSVDVASTDILSLTGSLHQGPVYLW